MTLKNNTVFHEDRLPDSFRPLLWGLKWDSLDIEDDKEDIIVSAINEGSLLEWRWVISKYGKDKIRQILEKRLKTEFHPESRNLAKLIFNIPSFRDAR